MKNEHPPLPIDALPAMDRLMSYFNLAVKESIKLYQKGKNRHDFEQNFLKFEQDLDLFEKSYDLWMTSDRVGKGEKTQLNELKSKMTEAKDLILLARRFITH